MRPAPAQYAFTRSVQESAPMSAMCRLVVYELDPASALLKRGPCRWRGTIHRPASRLITPILSPWPPVWRLKMWRAECFAWG